MAFNKMSNKEHERWLRKSHAPKRVRTKPVKEPDLSGTYSYTVTTTTVAVEPTSCEPPKLRSTAWDIQLNGELWRIQEFESGAGAWGEHKVQFFAIYDVEERDHKGRPVLSKKTLTLEILYDARNKLMALSDGVTWAFDEEGKYFYDPHERQRKLHEPDFMDALKGL